MNTYENILMNILKEHILNEYTPEHTQGAYT